MSIPDLKACGPVHGKLDEKYLNYKHANNTLIISVRRSTNGGESRRTDRVVRRARLLHVRASAHMHVRRCDDHASSLCT
jgi:hypothetical protein